MRSRHSRGRVRTPDALIKEGAGESLALPQTLDLGRGNIKGIRPYREQQTYADVREVRYYMEEDGYGYKITDVMENYLVGAQGILVEFDDDELNKVWDNHIWSPDNEFKSFAAVQRFMVQCLVRDGEDFHEFVADKDDFLMMPIDMLELKLTSALRIQQAAYRGNLGYIAPTLSAPMYTGIDYDSKRRPTRYNFWSEEKGQYSLDARHIVHTWIRRYARQQRGLSWFIGALDAMRDLHLLDKDVAQGIKNAVSESGHYEIPPNLQSPIVKEEDNTLLLEQLINSSPDIRRLMPQGVKFMPANVSNIFAGTAISMQRHALLSRIAANVGLAYYTVSGDVSTANFSALQQGNLDNRALFRKGQDVLLASVRSVVKEWMLWLGLSSSRMAARVRRAAIRFIRPPFEYIDRAKAALADEKMLKLGATSLTQIIQASGQDPDTIFEQQASDEAKRRAFYMDYGVPFPGDNQSGSDEDPNLTNKEDDDIVNGDTDNTEDSRSSGNQ